MHKCLPLANAIYVLVNVSKTFVINNSTRMRRNIHRIKTSLNEYIHEMLDDEGYFDFNEEDEEEENGREKLEIYNEIAWKPEMDALFRYGAWLTSTRQFLMDNDLSGMPKNFVEDLFLHLANSRSTSQMMLQKVKIYFGNATLPIPTFLKQFTEIDAEDENCQIGGRCLFESAELEAENGQILRIFEGELSQTDEEYELKLCVMNIMDRENLFQILINLDLSKKFIRELEFSQWKMQSLDDFAKLNEPIEDDDKLDLFLRRGAGFSPFRHFKLKQNFCINYGEQYADFLISYISNTKHPEQFLDSIDIHLEYDMSYSSINQIWKICQKGIPKGGKCMNFDNKKLHILSGKTVKPKKHLVDGSFSLFGPAIFEDKLQFTLANVPSNGEYLFDVDVKFGNWRNQLIRMKIQKRKNDKIVELKCRCHHGIELEKKKKEANDDDGKEDKDEPTYSGKIMNHK